MTYKLRLLQCLDFKHNQDKDTWRGKKRIYAYVIRTKDYATRFRTTEPDYSYLPDQNFDWADTIYGHVQEIIPDDIPDPLGKSVTSTTTVDANLNHCLPLEGL